MTMGDWINLLGTLCATFLGAWFGYLAGSKQEQDRDAKLHVALKGALLAEAEMCIARANTYLAENYLAPAYRMPFRVYDAAFPQLIATGKMVSTDVKAVLDFYSQVQQINWSLDEIHRHVQDSGDVGPEEGKARKEQRRLIAKLREMNAPGTRFFDPVMRALGGPTNILSFREDRPAQPAA